MPTVTTKRLTQLLAGMIPLGIELSVTDGLKVGDSRAESLVSGITIIDGLKLGDIRTTGMFETILLSVTDGLKLGDSRIVNIIGGLIYISLTDGLKLGDSRAADTGTFTILGKARFQLEVHNSSGALLHLLKNLISASYSLVLNEPHVLAITTPADEDAATALTVPNELWLRDLETGVVVRKFLLHFTETSR